MLTRLVIHDVVLIDKLNLALSSGLNVFTGETGAGKSIVLDAMGLALGERSDAGLVRQGKQQATVTAEFTLPRTHAANKLAEEQGLAIDDTLVLRRVVGIDGKSRAFINDQPVGVNLLKRIGERLLEIHGQFDAHGLLNPSTHLGLLDAFGGMQAEKKDCGDAFDAWQEAQTACQLAEETRNRAAAEEEFLRAAVNELEELAPEADEANHLAERRTALQHHEKITEALQSAEQTLNGERGALATLAQAGKTVARVSDKMPKLAGLLAAIDRAADEAANAAAMAERFLNESDAEPEALQKIEERLFALRAIARKHGVLVDALPELLRDLSAKLSLLSDSGDQITALRQRAGETRKIFAQKAAALSAKRKTAAQRMEKAIAAELPPLKLERARFFCRVEAADESAWSKNGMDRVTFLAATNPGSPAGPLHKVASGGELSRFMLALKVVLAASDPVPTLVFDEVDAGIGGATASAVGERLAQLAKQVQILVVTHSPQVAARANAHLRVFKELRAKLAATSVAQLNERERREEIARMLSGAEVTEAARQAADSLMENPQQIQPVQRKKNTK